MIYSHSQRREIACARYYAGIYRLFRAGQDPGIAQGDDPASDRVLLVDEWIETGAQIQAAIHLIENEGGVIVGIATINMDWNPLIIRLQKQYFLHSIAKDSV